MIVPFRRWWLATACVICMLSCGTGTAGAQQVTARAWVDSVHYLVGDPITVRIQLRHTPGLSMQPLVGDTVGGFTVLQKPELRRDTDSTSGCAVVMARYDSGDARIPPIPILFFRGGDTAQRYAYTNQLLVTVHTVPPDTGNTIRDIKPPLWIPLAVEDILLYGGILIFALALGYVAYRYWRKRRMRQAGEVYVPPPRPAHIVAFEELATLKEKQLWQRGLIKQYYSEVTEILRRYIEHRYRQPALEETTGEIVEGLRKLRLAPELLETAGRTLENADLVKFAKHAPSTAEHEATYQTVYAFVDRTRHQEMTPVSDGNPGEEQHVPR